MPSKPANCAIEFFEIDVLQRPYDVLAEVRVIPHGAPDPLVKEEMRGQACMLGADAVIGLHSALEEGQLANSAGRGYTLVGTAVRYRQK